MAQPDWLTHVQFDTAVTVAAIMADRSLIPRFKGFYAFALDKTALRRDRVLYIGKTVDQGGFRSRFSFYLRADPTSPTSQKHKGGLFLQHLRLCMTDPDYGASAAADRTLPETVPQAVWVHFAPFETDDPGLVRDLEVALMQYFNAWYNTAGMKASTPFDTI